MKSETRNVCHPPCYIQVVNLLVIGATGGVGQWLVNLGLKRGHTVTAFARAESGINAQHERLRVIVGDVLVPETLIAAVSGQDAVLSALGARTLEPNTTCSEGMRNLTRAMEQAGVRRLIAVSSLGVGDSRKRAGFFLTHFTIPLLLKNAVVDLERAEEIIRSTELDWIIVRPGGLTNHRPVHHYRVAEGGLRSGRIARGDVASFMLQQLEDKTYLRKAVAIAG